MKINIVTRVSAPHDAEFVARYFIPLKNDNDNLLTVMFGRIFGLRVDEIEKLMIRSNIEDSYFEFCFRKFNITSLNKAIIKIK